MKMLQNIENPYSTLKIHCSTDTIRRLQRRIWRMRSFERIRRNVVEHSKTNFGWALLKELVRYIGSSGGRWKNAQKSSNINFLFISKIEREI